MKEDYSDFIAMAQEMIEEFGREITVSIPPIITAQNQWNPPKTPSLIKTNAAFVGSIGGYGAIVTSDDLFQKSQQIALVAPPADGSDLSKTTQIIDNGQKWTVNILKALQPASDIILYYLGVSQ